MKWILPSMTLCLVLAVLAWPAGEALPAERDGDFATLLSETGYFENLATLEMSDGFVPYAVNVEAWADGAKKRRFFRLPPGQSATFTPEGAWEFPVGTVFLQTLELPLGEEAVRRLETRVIEKREEGLAFATYVWRPDHGDAELVTGGRRMPVKWDGGYQQWRVTRTSRCTRCHNDEAQPLLGMTTAQLDRDVDGKNQVDELARRKLVRGVPADRSKLTRLADPHDANEPLDRRARSYLDINCSVCHRPEGNGSGTMDLRYDTPFAKTGLGPKKDVFHAGNPFDSWIFLRMVYTDRRHMPNVLTIQTDRAGSDLIRDWVRSKKVPESASDDG